MTVRNKSYNYSLLVRKARRFADDEMSLKDFNDWFIPYVWDWDCTIVNDIKGELYDYDNGRISVQELRRRIGTLVG